MAIPGHSGGPKPLRAENAVRGLRSLTGRDATRVEEANSFIDFTLAQIAKMVTEGNATILESPARSHLWSFQQLKDIRQMPGWQRTLYDACCWGGARRKQQALESNVPEIQALQASCHHVHSKSEWTPYKGKNGAMVYPSSGEAEYTADLAFGMAVALSWWAIRTGRATLRVPRAPSAQEAGNRVGWPDMPPQVMRSWVMAATAVRLGLEPPREQPGGWFPAEDTASITCWRRQITAKDTLGDAVYVGQAEGSSKMPRTKWSSPFVLGQHGTPAECFTKYVLWFRSQRDLRGALGEIAGKELACECPITQPCHADFLASQARVRPDDQGRKIAIQRRGRFLPQLVMATLASQASAWHPGQGEVHQRWPQWGLDAAIRSLFPKEWTQGMPMPVLDDLVNSAPFTTFPEFLEDQDLEADAPLGPTIMTSYTRGQRHLAEGNQRGSFFAADAVPQIIPLGLTADAHFAASAAYADQGSFPMDEGLAVEIDLQCAASWTVSRMDDIADARTSCYKAVVALAERLQPLSQHLRRQQKGAIAKVAGGMHVAFLAVAVVLMNWPDTKVPCRYITGFRSLGMMEATGVLRQIPRIDAVPVDKLLTTAPAAFAALDRCVPTDEAAAFLLSECHKDLSKGFAGPLMTKEEADSRWGSGLWLPMPRFETIQASGKHRPIDDGKRFGHNSASGFSETIECCSAFQPVVHARALTQQAILQGAETRLSQHKLETGGEDMPEAYRWVPADPKEGALNVIATWSSEGSCWLFQEMFGQVFGRAAAVINFHRVQRLLVGMVRRWLLMLCSMYYDDVSLQDLAAARGRGQRYIRALFRLVGLPLQASKQVDLNDTADFLGMTHEVADSLQTNRVLFTPRAQLLAKAIGLIQQRLQEDSCTPAQVSKIRGVLGFLFTGVYGRVGRGGQQPLLQRQYSDTPPWNLSHTLRRALEYLLDTMMVVKPREVLLRRDPTPPLVIASDGRQDNTSPPSIAALLLDPSTGQKIAIAAVIGPELMKVWGDTEHCIALVEQAAIILGIIRFREVLRGRSLLWFEDNSVVLSGLVKGSSGHPLLDAGAATIHLMLAALEARAWFEYVESDANWSDGASRLLAADPWAKANGFTVEMGSVPTWPWLAQGNHRMKYIELMLDEGATVAKKGATVG